MTISPDTLRSLSREGDALVYVCEMAAAGVRVSSASVDDPGTLTSRAETAAALSRDVDRALRHLDLSAWRAISVECEGGSLALARADVAATVSVVAARRGLPLGLVQRTAARAAGKPSGALR